LQEEVDGQLRQARREIDQIVQELREKTKAISQSATAGALTTGDAGAFRTEAREAVEAVARRHLEQGPEPAPTAPPPVAPPPLVGDRVIISGLGLEAVVTGIHDGSADLDVRGKRMRASVHGLSVVGSPTASRAKVSVHVELQPREAVPTDLNVIGCSVDEALARADRFLDESLLADQRVVRVIHGYGTGQLRRALSGFLQQHPLVARFEAAPPEQGGGGVTVVELKD
jgi:DNA mismatch repair protein MutS2